MGFDEATLLGNTAVRYEAVVLRQHPHLYWADGGGQRTAIVSSRMVAGSAEGVDLVLKEPTVSRLHAELDPRPSGLWVRDLGSRNGTFIDGVRVESGCVPDRGQLKLGGLAVAVHYGPQPSAVELSAEPRFGPLLGASTAMRELFARLARMATSEATVLIQGETGTGKELVARALHEASPRAAGPFVIVDCGALPESLRAEEVQWLFLGVGGAALAAGGVLYYFGVRAGAAGLGLGERHGGIPPLFVEWLLHAIALVADLLPDALKSLQLVPQHRVDNCRRINAPHRLPPSSSRPSQSSVHRSPPSSSRP
jgi:Sigma-54 interaction domain/FHA domain